MRRLQDVGVLRVILTPNVRHHIEPRIFYPSTSYAFPRCFEAATIFCHANCRADKTDLCLPDWVFEKIEAAGIRLVS